MTAVPLPFVLGARWRADALLARGGGSSVYRATDLETGGEVAVKLGEPWRSDSPLEERFEREASALAIIASDHVVRVLAEGRSVELGAPFLVMERLHGHDLAQEIKHRGPLAVDETLTWFEQAAVALELAHGVGIIHRDLKPANLFLHEPPGGGRVLKILDFGLVKRLDPDATPIDPDAFAGTPAYMAPEQVLGHAARTGPATDVWAMGMVAVTMLTGERYWLSARVEDILQSIRHEPLVAPSQRWTWLPRAFDEWFRRSCDRVAERRFRSVGAQSDALRRAMGGEPGRGLMTAPALPRGAWDDRATASFSRLTSAVATAARDLPYLPGVAPLVGRDAERRELVELLTRREGGLVTITGAAGAGKSHLAEAVASDLEPGFPHGVWMVPLAAVRDPAHVPDAIADAVGLPRDPVLDVIGLLAEQLRDKRALIVLDNLEHLLPARAAIAELRAACPRVSWLVTSRAPLGIAGEERYALAPLEVPTGPGVSSPEEAAQYSAVRLFVERARAAVPNFRLTGANAADVAEICRRLEGLPLAIELAAARVRSLRELGARLGNGHAMHATIAWSYELLGEPERTVFRRLAIYPGAVDEQAAAAVCSDDTLDDAFGISLAALVDSSLVHRTYEEPPRLAMLETVRDFGLEQLAAAGEIRDTHARAFGHFARRAEEADAGLRGPSQKAWLDALAADHDNIASALTWALAESPTEALALAARLSWFWYLRGHYREGREWLDQALARATDAPAAVRARALFGAGELAFLQCDYRAAGEHLGESARLSRALGDERGVAAAEQMLGSIARERGSYEIAAEHHERCRAVWGRLGDRREEARSLNYLAFVAWIGAQDHERARDLATRAGRVFAEIGDKEGTVWSSLNLGAAAFHAGDLAAAAGAFDQAFRESVGVRYQEGLAWALEMQGRCSLARREPSRARAQLRASLKLHRRLGDLWRSGSVLEALAAVTLAARDAERAAFLLGAARAVRRRIDVPVPAAERAFVDGVAEAVTDRAADVARGEAASLDEALVEAEGDQKSR